VRPAAPVNLVLIKGLSLLGCRAGEVVRRTPDGVRLLQRPRLARLFQWAAEGRLRPFVSHEFPLEGVQAAFRAVRQREVVGRVVVDMEAAAALCRL